MSLLQSSAARQNGFSGELPEISLADLVQFQGQNRFTGAISVQQDHSKGTIFFRDGQVIHAEQGKRTGLDAVKIMLGWDRGGFSCQTNLETTQSSIDMPLQQVLLECHRVLDENRARGEQPQTEQKQSSVRSRLIKKLLPIEGVDYATLLDDNGTAKEDNSATAARLSAQAKLVRDVGDQIGQILSIGSTRSAIVSGNGGHGLLLVTQARSLFVSIARAVNPIVTENRIRKTLSPTD